MITIKKDRRYFRPIQKIGSNHPTILAMFKIAEINNTVWLVAQNNYSVQPTEEDLKAEVYKAVNEYIDDLILQGYEYEGNMVWLSAENQSNYKAIYDIAKTENGANLPVKVKLGFEENPYYLELNTVEDVTKFYLGITKYIQQCQELSWSIKDSFKYKDYILDDEG